MMRIGGLATGMDTDAIIKDMMQANRIPLDKITQKKQQLEWKLDDYRSINRDLKKFDDNLFNNMILSNSFTQKTVDVSAPDAVSIKNVSSTSDFSGTLQIHQLAKSSTLQSGKITIPTGMTVNSTLAELGLVTDGLEKTITINAIGENGEMPKESFSLKLKPTDSLQSVLNSINKNTNVNAFFDSHTGKIAMTAKHGGGEDIEVGGNFNTLKLNTDTEVDSASRATKEIGQNAIFTFNGLETQRSSNTFQINGFEVTLKKVTAPLEGGEVVKGAGETVTFSSAADTDKILETVVKFVDDYNKLIEDLNAQLREPKYRDFHPLSAEQKGDMKEKEIEMWEEKAMSGMLRNDPIISSMLSKMRTALMNPVGEGTLSDIGITTSKDYMEHGKLVIDETALRAAINEDPNKVHELFSKNGATEADQGIGRRLREVVGINGAQKQISALAGKSANAVNDSFTLGRNLNDMDKQIARFEDRLKMTEDRLWKQFTAMEMAIQKANAQSAQLMNSFGG